jgi:glycoprotein 6-alpha-L-fucosyltransferase
MQTRYPDAYNRFKSLDDIYYYGGQNAHNVVAVLDHQPKSSEQIQLKTGDQVGIAGEKSFNFEL